VSATPVVVDGRLYVPDWAGNLWCLDANTGSTIWSKNISQLVHQADPSPSPPAPAFTIISRASPAISGGTMVSLNNGCGSNH